METNFFFFFNNSGDNNIRLNDQTRKSKNSEPQKQLDENDNEIDNVVTYYFIIPYQSISSQTGQINKIALYNDDNSIGINSVTELTNFQLEQYASAIITLSSPISLSGLGSGDSILVNWSMTISTSNE